MICFKFPILIVFIYINRSLKLKGNKPHISMDLVMATMETEKSKHVEDDDGCNDEGRAERNYAGDMAQEPDDNDRYDNFGNEDAYRLQASSIVERLAATRHRLQMDVLADNTCKPSFALLFPIYQHTFLLIYLMYSF